MNRNVRNGQAYRFRRFARKSYAAFNSMHKTVSIGVLSGSMLVSSGLTQVMAQDNNRLIQEKDSIVEDIALEEIEVLAVQPFTFTSPAKSVTIISSKEIERQPSVSIQDLLKSIPGLDVRQRGTNGVLAGISVRGGTFEQTTILLNGANFSNPQTAHYSLDIPINLSDIERIEIIEGASSSLSGSSAFAGGINIITKQDTQSSVFLQAEGGMHKLLGGQARGTFRHGDFSHSLSLGYNSSDGYIDNSDYKLFNTFWQSHWKKKRSSMHFQLGYNDKKYGANTFYSAAYPNQYDETKSLFASFRAETGNSNLKIAPHLYWTRHYDEFHLFRPKTEGIPSWYTAPNSHISDVFGFKLHTRYLWKLGVLSLGGEIRNEGIRSSNLGKLIDKPDDKYTHKDNRTNISYFVEQTFLTDNLSLSAGLLANYNTAFSDDFSFFPNLNASYWLTNKLKVYASWNMAMRMPTFTDLYYSGATHIGNSDVKPEKSSSLELGFKYQSGIFSAHLAGFYLKGSDMIDWVKQNPDDKWETRNLTSLERMGLEASVGLDFRSFDLNIGYTFMNQDKKSTDWISNYVLDYLKHKVTLGLSHPIVKNLTADWQFRWQDRAGTYTQYTNNILAEEVSYPSFALLDVKVNYKLPWGNIFLLANNLFDKTYYDLGNIPQPGIWLQGGINYTFK